jgi:hypothetical protein
MLDRSISIRWYRIIESTESTNNRLGPQAKFKANKSCAVKRSDRNIGANVVVGRGIIKISLVSILNKSASIWKAPLRPINVGPIRLWAKARSFRSDKTQNKVNNTTSNALSKIPSDI